MYEISKFCPVCKKQWQFIHEHGDDWFLAHYCEIAGAYVFWNRTYIYYSHQSRGDER